MPDIFIFTLSVPTNTFNFAFTKLINFKYTKLSNFV
ncbi:hypothetical protein SAMN06296427_104124 [Moheibacter sediminis]|uniref:Uncharacterized protein n=1 Tax=Moheibacter sediminis TaxID=1434700 RepID=A0A1W2AG93_9FLAO|nr:hypothetical protein SAMN06296427_104124 [Moheibacter sediminis]